MASFEFGIACALTFWESILVILLRLADLARLNAALNFRILSSQDADQCLTQDTETNIGIPVVCDFQVGTSPLDSTITDPLEFEKMDLQKLSDKFRTAADVIEGSRKVIPSDEELRFDINNFIIDYASKISRSKVSWSSGLLGSFS